MSAAWMKFYPSDWRADPALRMCSIGARGLWLEMLCVMHEAEPRGFLLVKGAPVNERQLAALCGIPLREVNGCLVELDAAGVFSREDGTIFSRRMRRDTEKAERDKANGKGGGNPHLKGGVNEGVNPRVKAQKPEARSQKKEAAQQSSPPPPEPDRPRKAEIDALEGRLRTAAGLENDPSPSLFDLSPMLTLIGKGYDLERDILPVLKSVAARGKRGGSWRYYVKAIEEAKVGNDAIREAPAGGGNGSGGKPSVEFMLGWYRKNGGEFLEGNGPGQWGYRHDLPPDVQAQFDAIDDELAAARKARYDALQRKG